jgi:hypothetical protein
MESGGVPLTSLLLPLIHSQLNLPYLIAIDARLLTSALNKFTCRAVSYADLMGNHSHVLAVHHLLCKWL